MAGSDTGVGVDTDTRQDDCLTQILREELTKYKLKNNSLQAAIESLQYEYKTLEQDFHSLRRKAEEIACTVSLLFNLSHIQQNIQVTKIQ